MLRRKEGGKVGKSSRLKAESKMSSKLKAESYKMKGNGIKYRVMAFGLVLPPDIIADVSAPSLVFKQDTFFYQI